MSFPSAIVAVTLMIAISFLVDILAFVLYMLALPVRLDVHAPLVDGLAKN